MGLVTKLFVEFHQWDETIERGPTGAGLHLAQHFVLGTRWEFDQVPQGRLRVS